jgi:uncharacterized protein
VRPWGRLIAGVTAAAAAVVGLAIYGAYQVISPRRCDHRDDPAVWGLPCEEVRFGATDGVQLAAWLARARERGPAIIVVHGHGGNRHTSLAYASFLYPRFTLLLPDLRGHGDSQGRHTSVGYLERRDIIGAALYLRELGYGPIGVFGISMGGATAILAAAESDTLDAVAADSSFAALRHAVREGARIRGYPGPIIRPLAYLSCQTAAWCLRYPMRAGDPLGCVGAIAPRPLLLIHGEADSLITVDNAHTLYAAAGEPKELWILPEVEHARAIESDGESYKERVLGFFTKWLAIEEPFRATSGTMTLEAGALEVGQPASDAGSKQVDQVA